MKKTTFEQALAEMNLKIKEIESKMQTEKLGREYMNEVKTLHPALELAYSDELMESLIKANVIQKIEEVVSKVEKNMALVKNYKLDIANQKMIITYHLGQETKQSQTIQIDTILDKKFKLSKSSNLYYVVMSILMNEEVFEVFQLENALA